MRFNWKFLPLAMLSALPFLLGGCGGINASQSVSPASLFLPGLLKNDTRPATNAPTALPEPSKEFAAAK